MSVRRVMFIIDRFDHANAGTENQLSILLRELPESWEMDFVVFRPSPWIVDRQEEFGIRVTEVRIESIVSVSALSAYRDLTRTIRKFAPEIVHTFFPVANILGVLAASSARVPVVLSSRRDFGEWMSRRYLAATRFANRYVNGVVVNSDQVRQLTVDAEGYAPEKIKVIKNGIDIERFADLPDRSESRGALGLARDSVVVGIVANFRPMKMHNVLVEAASIVLQKHPEAEFLLVGENAVDWDLKGEIQALAHSCGVAERFVFVDNVDDIRPALAAIDIAVNCSTGEGLSNAIMEYMAAGLCCIVANSGGNAELIDDGRTGRLFPVGDVAALADCLIEMIEEPERRASLGSRAAANLRQNYSIDRMVSQFTEYYDAMVEKREAS